VAEASRDVCAGVGARAAGDATGPGWAAIAQVLGKQGMRLEEGYARLREAECHLLDGDRDRAAHALAAGQHIAADSSSAWLARDLDALARRGRLQAPREAAPAAEDPIGLTERERAVLELVALGMTNREIGEQLFMATKTASVHVSRILTKLGVSSRVEAATAAQRLGLVP
jgi:ATP/maltotriose-dependent transcriptional regulator MalT